MRTTLQVKYSTGARLYSTDEVEVSYKQGRKDSLELSFETNGERVELDLDQKTIEKLKRIFN